jgi:hypothetical protein
VLAYDGCSVGASVDTVPDLIARIYERKGAEGGSLRALRNNLVLIVADDGKIEEMRQKMARRLALQELKKPERLGELAEHQQAKVKELEAKSEADVAIAIQQCYRHLFYPLRSGLGDGAITLAHTALDIHSVSEKPGAGQQQIVRHLRELRQMRTSEDEPDSPAYTRDRTPLKRGQVTTLALRDEFRKDPNLPILIGDDVFIKGIRKGIEQGEYVYRRGELLYGPGDPHTSIAIDEQATVFTMAYAKEHGIWPRPKPQPATSPIGTSAGNGQQPLFGGSTNGPGLAETVTATTGPVPGSTPGPAPITVEQPPAGPPSFTAEAPLREALIRLWEQARARRVERIATLTIRMFDATDAFRLLGVVAAVRSADQKQVVLEGGYETKGGSSVEVAYKGTPQDAQPLKDFLDPQLRAANEKNLQARFEMGFTDGLPLAGEAPEKLAEQLTRFATGAAYVEATAEARV